MDCQKAIAAGLLLSVTSQIGMQVYADEGFFSPNTVPYQAIHATYPLVDLTPEKVQRLTQATVKITSPYRPGQGGTGVFISPDGLVLTNHHVAEHCLEDQRLARARPNPQAPFGQHFFYAPTLEQEIPCYAYHIQGSIIFKNVKLVYLPSAEIAKFGSHLLKDIALQIQPIATYQADFAFLRVYDESSIQPLNTSELYLPPNTQSTFQEGDFVMTASFPNNTQRHRSYLYLQHLYDVVLPLDIFYLSAMEDVLIDRIRRLETQPNADKTTRSSLIHLHDGIFTQRLYQGLQRILFLNLGLIERQFSQDMLLATALKQDPTLTPRFSHLFPDLNDTYTALKQTYPSAYWLQKLLDTSLFNTPYRLIRQHLPSIPPSTPSSISRSDLNPRGPFRSEVEEAIHFLSEALRVHRDERFDIPWIVELTRPISHANTLTAKALATRIVYRLIQTTRFYQSPTYRYELLTADTRMLRRDLDPLIRTTVTLHQALQAAKQRTQELEQTLETLHLLYWEAHQTVFASTPHYKNADSSLRFSYGQIQGLNTLVMDQPFSLPEFSSFFSLKDQQVGGKSLMNRFKPDEVLYLLRAKNLFEDLPVNILSTLDIAHGSSGSALVNADLQVMGTNFARNWAPQIHDAIYHEAHRAVSVSLPFILAYLAAEVAGAFTDEPPERPPSPNRIVQELQAAENHVSKTTR